MTAIIKIKYKNKNEFLITIHYEDYQQLLSIINSLHEDFNNIDYYKVDEIDL